MFLPGCKISKKKMHDNKKKNFKIQNFKQITIHRKTMYYFYVYITWVYRKTLKSCNSTFCNHIGVFKVNHV